MRRAPLDLVFMGTPAFAATILAALIDAGHRIAAVYTQPPRPAGRGHRETPSPVEELAVRRGLPVNRPVSLRGPEEAARFVALGAGAAVVAAYGLILPRAFLEAPRLGCLNVHASLLPRWRGAAPVERALIAGDHETGVTIMQMEEGLDTGPMLLQRSLAVARDATGGSLTAELAALGGELVVEALDGVAEGRLTPRPQPEAGVTYARKIMTEEVRLDWRLPAQALERRVRAFDPRPGAFFEARGERIRVLAAEAIAGGAKASAGTVIDERLSIVCGEGVLRPSRLQRAGRSAMEAAAFLRGFAIPPGMVLPCPATSC